MDFPDSLTTSPVVGFLGIEPKKGANFDPLTNYVTLFFHLFLYKRQFPLQIRHPEEFANPLPVIRNLPQSLPPLASVVAAWRQWHSSDSPPALDSFPPLPRE